MSGEGEVEVFMQLMRCLLAIAIVAMKILKGLAESLVSPARITATLAQLGSLVEKAPWLEKGKLSPFYH